MNDKLLRQEIRAVHVQIHRLRQQPAHPIQFGILKQFESNLAELYFARQQLKRIEARRQCNKSE
jgi:hypothetical protein